MSLPDKLMTVDQWVEQRPDLYPSGRNSFEWRWQTRKSAYLRGGGILIVAGKQRMVNPPAMEKVEAKLVAEDTERFLARQQRTAADAAIQ